MKTIAKVKTNFTIYLDLNRDGIDVDKPDGKVHDDYEFIRKGSVGTVYDFKDFFQVDDYIDILEYDENNSPVYAKYVIDFGKFFIITADYNFPESTDILHGSVTVL